MPGDRVYDVLSTAESVERAFAGLERIKKHIVWWDDGSELPLRLTSGNVAMSSAWNGRIYSVVRDRGEKLAVIWDGQIWEMGFWAIPKGSEHRDMALHFLSFATDAQRLADQSKQIAYGLVRQSAMALVIDDVRPHLPTAESNRHKALRLDDTWWIRPQDAMETRFAAWVEQQPWRYDFDKPDGN